ncbi:hypothetical protein AB6A40_007123 [Gnathostoma spinigerum]|uniref:Peptidase C1A papain C-terminal domain-containing protein n=1 Tax=Gnathostoma spinigerum TaxID=75299 RepID=A0ABD6EKC0_9BILA
MANSWNTDWGENGYFRILRGKNECDLERGASAGMPDTMRYHEDLAITGGILC